MFVDTEPGHLVAQCDSSVEKLLDLNFMLTKLLLFKKLIS